MKILRTPDECFKVVTDFNFEPCYTALLANSRAIENGEEVWETEIDGSKWSQNTFNYQAKCLQWINAEFFSLSSEDQKKILDLFNGTGCEKLLIKEQ